MATAVATAPLRCAPTPRPRTASCVRIMRRLRGPFVAVVMAALAAAGSAVVVVTVTVKVVGAVAVPREHPAGDVTDPAARPQAAQEASGPTVIPFPAPPPSPWVGRFHELPSLQCRLHPTTPGGVSPDPEAVTNPFGRGGTGWVLRAHPEAVNVVVPYGAGTCASPLNDVFQLSYLAAPNEVRERWVFKASTNVSMGADATAEFAWAGGAYRAHLSWLAMQGSQVQESDGFRSSELFRPNPCTTAHARSGLVCEEEVARMLSIHRNQGVGTIRRHRGIYDVLSVHRTSYGVTLDERGEVVVALDIVSDASGLDNVAVVQYTTRDGHERPVLAGETALLTLGRAVVADPSWLGAAFPGGLNASVFFSTLHPSTSYQSVTWPLRHGATATNSSRWLQNLATTLCTPPASSFVVDDSFCDGVRQRSRSLRFPLRAGGRPVAASLGLSAVTTVSQTEMEHVWIINLPDKNVTALACPDFDGWTYDNATQPLWLLGRSDRELHTTGPTGSTEMELAASLSSCAMSDVRKDLASVYNFLDHLTYQLSQRYRRDRFQADPPDDPFSDAGLLLAVLVVVPEVAAILLLLVQPRSRQRRLSRWYGREGSTMVLVLAAGAVALIGIGFADRQEHVGHAWRASTVQNRRRIAINETEQLLFTPSQIDYSGRLTIDEEILYIVARSGFRPTLTRLLLAVSVAVYAVLCAAVLLRVGVAMWRERSGPEHGVENDADGVKPRRPRRRRRRRGRTAALPVEEGAGPSVDGNGDGSDGGGSGGGGGAGIQRPTAARS